MNSVLALAAKKKFQSKTDKSFINILTGYKSHQTYFDALMQGMMPFYHAFPELKALLTEQDGAVEDYIFYPYFYDSAALTFQSLRLLTQSLSAYAGKLTMFYPVTNHLYVQQQVKHCFAYYKNHPDEFKAELISLYEQVEQQLGACCSFLLLPDGCGQHSSRSELTTRFQLPADALELVLLKEFNLLTELIRQHPVLSPLYIRLPLHSATEKTAALLSGRLTIQQMAAARGVKHHTIEDHLIEMMIKDYPFDWQRFIRPAEVGEIRALYDKHAFERLKPYFENSSIDDYFKIKLAICLVIKGEYNGPEADS
ncbi:helix-turn-helix domain-containing protein [Macrococcus equipercicus]|nr:helix-turn-helix domain-containing protein [Macrococcus equipercicus]